MSAPTEIRTGTRDPAAARRPPPPSAAAGGGNYEQRRKVVDYYNQSNCDYRIVWRTDENDCIHYGFFPHAEPISPLREKAVAVVLSSLAWLSSIVVTPVIALLGTRWGSEAAVRTLGFATRYRSQRHNRAQRAMNERCARVAGIRAGERVLDAGCGVGGGALWLRDSAGANPFPVNIQPLHLARAKDNAERTGRQLHLSAQDYTELAFASASFDVVWALESVCHCVDKSRFVAESHRVLRAGGRIMVADFFGAKEDLTAAEAEDMRTWLDGWAIPNLATVEGFRAELARAGFCNISCRDIRSNVMPSAWRLYKASFVAPPVAAVPRLLGLRTRRQSANVSATRYQYPTLRDAVWTYAIFYAEKPDAPTR